ncbi:MAG: insulinase family protein [Phycisphaerales bacterium]|nr:insulinase family protein [Phycisphaerales bacterium]
MTRSAFRPAALLASVTFCSITLAQPLPTDQRLVTGELPNGMRYIVKKHANPPGRASMWLHISTGSMNETDAQRGIAHYLEHMAFNGSENFKPGSVIDFFQSMGLMFGQHQNAFTSFDQTTYQLALPDTKPETLDKGMLFFSDVAGRLSLLPAEIDEERQVIFEEKRTRKGAQQRVQEYMLERLIPGSLIGYRLPIGTDETLKSVMQPDFRDYYSHWYIPSNMTLMVVADAEPAPIVEQIGKHFGAGDKKPVPVDQDPKVKPLDASRAIVATDPELTGATVEVYSVGAKEDPATTVPLMRRDFVRQIGISAFNRRMGAKLSKGGTAYLSASAGAMTLFNAATLRQVSAEGKPEDWKTMLTELGADTQRARLHGFSQQEIDDVKKEITAGLEQFVAQESTMDARRVLNMMNRAIADGEPIMSAQQELDLSKQILPGISAEEVSRTFAELFNPVNVTYVLNLPSSAEVPTEAQLVAMGAAAFDVKPEAEKQADRPSSLLAELPAAGKASDLVTHAASAVTSGWLSNGVRFHHRFMDIEKDRVAVSITLAAGPLQESAENHGVSEVAALAWERPATSKLTSTNIRDIRTGKKTRVRGGIAGPDAMSLSVNGSPSDLDDGMQLAYLMLTDPVIEQANFDQWKKEQLQSIEERDKNIQAALGVLAAKTIMPEGDARFQPITADEVNRLSVAAGQAWLTSAIRTAPIEVTVVGDIDKDVAVSLLEKYVGSLPSRDRISAATLDQARKVGRPPANRTAAKSMATQTDKAVAMVGFYGPDAANVQDTRCMSIASRILSTRAIQIIREKEQLAYSPGCRLQPGTAIPGYGVFMGLSPTDPGKVDRLVAAYGQLFDAFAAEGPTEEELTTARKQFANDMDEQMKQPGFWMGRVGAMDYRDVKLDDVMAAPQAYQTIPASDIKAAFAKYCKPESRFSVVVRPAEQGADATTETK